MTINYFSPNHIITWNDELDKDIWYLLSIVQWDISRFLNPRWNILCRKIDEQLDDILEWFNELSNLMTKAIFKSVREKLWIILDLSLELKRCKTFSKCEEALSKYWSLLILNTYALNIILNKCSSFSECEEALSKYWNWITLNTFSISIILNKCSSLAECVTALSKYWYWIPFNVVSLSTILKKILLDRELEKSTATDSIKAVLIWINNFWNLNNDNKNTLIAQIKSSSWKYNKFIYNLINLHNLSNLYFLNTLLTPVEYGNKELRSSKESTFKTPFEIRYNERLKEALNGWLTWDLAHDYAAWRLQLWIWSKARKSSKKWWRFKKI